MIADCVFHELNFKMPSGTSRGILRSKPSWFLRKKGIGDDVFAYGECSVIEGLSPDDLDQLPEKIKLLIDFINEGKTISDDFFNGFPALQFAYETLQLDFERHCEHKLFDSYLFNGEGIDINGLVWMGSKNFMLAQIKEKINQGFKCIKIKIAAIDFSEELSLLRYVRQEFNTDDIEIRVDANGGFKPDSALENLKRLSEFNLHSIEQPIMADNHEAMAELCNVTPLDIALDEELIGVSSNSIKRLLENIKPQYIILKPSLLGGFKASEKWIEAAEENSIDWWITSALESNIGLNAIAQWTTTFSNSNYQGLGTGQLFTNNIQSPLNVKAGRLYYDNGENTSWDFSTI